MSSEIPGLDQETKGDLTRMNPLGLDIHLEKEDLI